MLLHAYQPSWQFKETLKKIVEECYFPIFNFLLKEEKACFTVNINYALLELLESHGYKELLTKIERCIDQGKIDLTGSGAYHPILPLIPQKEAERQILLNEKGVERILGKFLRNGFFPPEMAFEKKIVKIIKRNDYRWTITEDVPFGLKHGYVPFDFIPAVEGLPVFLRSSLWSKKIALEQGPGGRRFAAAEIVEWLNYDLGRWFGGKDGYLIIAMDMETFGHHIREYNHFLKEFLEAVEKKREMRMVFISELLQHFPIREIEVPAGSWSTEPNDIWQSNPYPLWKCKWNEAHKFLWKLVNLALESLKEENEETRALMDRGLNSCQFWWLARGNWNPPIAFQTIPMLVRIISQDKPENLEEARKILAALEKITNTKISGLK